MRLVNWGVARQHLSKPHPPDCWKHPPNLLGYRDRVSTVRHHPQHVTVAKETEARELATYPLQLILHLSVHSFLERAALWHEQLIASLV